MEHNNYTLDTNSSALLSAVHDLSEDLWAAGWSIDLEFTLWSALIGDKRWPKAAEVHRPAVNLLAHLSSECDGWWVHCDTINREWSTCGGRVFMGLDDWRNLYASRSPDAQEEAR